MLKRVRSGEVDTPEEVAKAFNVVIDALNKKEVSDDAYNKAVEEYNGEVIEKGPEDA